MAVVMETAPSHLPLDRLTRRWWVLFALLLLAFVPVFSTRSFSISDTPRVVMEVHSSALMYWFSALFPLFKLLPVVLIIGLLASPGGFARWFHLYAAMNLLLIAFFQNAGETPTYGFAIVSGNVLVYGMLAALWGWEAVANHGYLRLTGRPAWRYWVVLPALLAFLFPAKITAGIGAMDFNPERLLINEAGMSFCMIMPVYLAVLTLAAPRVNLVVLRMSAFAGFVTAALHIGQFLLQPGYGWWMMTLHLPLLFVSLYAFGIAMTRRQAGRS